MLLGLSTVTSAQTRPVTRSDLNATIGWLAADAGSSGPYSSHQWESSLLGAVGAGWYWTDHLKTEIDFGAGTQAEAYLVTSTSSDGLIGYRAIERRFSRRVIGVGQQYQFFRNAWFHPHLSAGANLTWERQTDHTQPVYTYDPVTRASRLVQPGRVEGPRTEFTVRPFVAGGFKAYMTRRAFFRTDLRMGFKSGVDETMLRFGFGIDF